MKNPFKRRVVLPTIGVEVHILADAGKAPLGDVFGLTEERYRVLADIIQAGIERNEAPALTISAVSKACCHPNELAMCCFVIGSLYERQNNSTSGLLKWLMQ